MKKYHSFGIVEAAVAKLLVDNPASTTGPTYGPRLPFPGVQNGGYDLTLQQEKLLGDGLILAYESTVDDFPIDLEFAQAVPDIDALVMGLAAWHDENGSNFVVTEDIGDSYIGLWLRTNKTGTNGADSTIFVPKLKVGSLSRKGQQRQFRGNAYKAAASYTESTIKVIRDGVASYKRYALHERWNLVATPLVSAADVTAPTISAPSSAITGAAGVFTQEITFSERMNRNTVNEFTVLVLSGSIPVPATVTHTGGTGSDESKKFTITTDSALAAGSYVLKVLTVAADEIKGNPLAAEYTKAITLS